jgi:tripartite motif-containing protein 71
MGCGLPGLKLRLQGRICMAIACALLGVLALPASPAPAIERFGSFGTGAGELFEPFGIAVDAANGGIYILDTNNSRIEEFTSNGVFELAWGWGVADGRTHALQVCKTTCFIGLAGTGAGEFDFAEGIAVDNDPASLSYGDIYVSDIGNHRVQKFSPAGRFLLMFGSGVNETARERHETANEDICPVHAGDICTAGIRGSAPGQLEFPVEGHFIAVGRTGTVYLGARNSVQEFAPNGTYETHVTLAPPDAVGGGEAGGVSGLEVNAAGDLYVIRIGVKSVNVYEPSGRLIRSIDAQERAENPEKPTPVVALDAAGDAFIEHEAIGEDDISEFDSTGAKLATIDTPAQAGLHGIAYDDQTGHLYVIDAIGAPGPVLVLTPPDPAPFAAIGSEVARWLIPEV